MQLNPSSDFYDEDDDDDDDDDDDVLYDDDEGGKVVDENVTKQLVIREEGSELLPKAKGLVQPPSNSNQGQDKLEDINQEEEDMGYDEDDERIAIAVERPKDLRSNVKYEHGFVNEEGSGSFGRSYNRFKDNANDRFRFDYMDKYRRKHQKGHTAQRTFDGESEVDLRESSGNFANDDEDSDDDSDDNGDTNSDGLFNAKHKSNRYFRKNTNDAIKIISTPLGKVGIVYQQTNNEEVAENAAKKSTSFTDFDALSPDPESSHRLASSHPKITPVLTPDGKVALLYRGDSESTKYEPIRNQTLQKYNKAIDSNLSKKKTSTSHSTDIHSEEYEDSDSADEEDDKNSMKTGTHIYPASEVDLRTKEEQAAILPLPEVAPTKGSFIIRPTDSVLPMINRPLSEVLGIKKNQFTQIRIKDAEASIGQDSASRSTDQVDTTTLHFLTKVNLADFPTSSRAKNFDFDFSRDTTMLDERTRHLQKAKSQLNSNTQDVGRLDNTKISINTNQIDDIANAEILSKTEIVNLAVIPHFDEDLERLQRLREYEDRRHHRQRHRFKQNEEDLSGIHCIMQAMMGIAAISTVFGMLGTFFKQRILDQLRLMHW